MPLFILWIVVSALFAIGLIGTVVPILPGVLLVYVGILFYALVTGFDEVSPGMTLGFGVVALFSLLTTLIGPAAAVRGAGGRTLTMAGAVIGVILGVLTSGPLGLVVGAFVGALAGALIEGRSFNQAAGLAARSIIGALAATVVQFFLALVLIIAFFIVISFA